MAWHRTLLALAFLLATVLGNASFAPVSMADGGMDMTMPAEAMVDQGEMPENCSPCSKHDAAMPACVAATCAPAGATLPVATGANLVAIGIAFEPPTDQQVDGSIYLPDPHPPKSPILI